MKIPLMTLCAALAAITTLDASTSEELFGQLKAAATSEMQALRKAGKAGSQTEQQQKLSSALSQLALPRMEDTTFPIYQMLGMLQEASSSEKVKQLAKSLDAQLRKEDSERRDAEVARLNSLGKRCAEQWLAAKTAHDLDAPIAEVTAAMSKSRYGNDVVANGYGTLLNQLNELSALLQNRQDFFLKMEAGEKRQALAVLRQRQSNANGALVWIPRSALIETVQSDRNAAQPGFGNTEAAAKALGEKVFAAETAKDVDPLIADLGALQGNDRFGADEDPDGRISATVRSVGEFTRRWQDFLAARAAGNLEKTRSILSELTSQGREYPGIPRSEILARAYGEELGKWSEKKPVAAAAPFVSPEQILSKIKTLEDLDRFGAEFNAAINPERTKWSEMSSELQSIARTYRDLRAGNSARVSLNFSGSESKEPIMSLRVQLALFALPRAIGASEADQPQPNETALTYMRRMIAVARERKDWPFASRVLAAAQSTQVNDPLIKTSDSTALTLFFAGLNFEKGKQFSLAVNSFQMALKTGSDLIPAEDIGERLEAIKRNHAADYEAGLQLTLTPPAPQTDPYGRPLRDPRYPAGFPGGQYGPNGPAAPAKEQSMIVPAVKESAPKTAAPAAEPKKE